MNNPVDPIDEILAQLIYKEQRAKPKVKKLFERDELPYLHERSMYNQMYLDELIAFDKLLRHKAIDLKKCFNDEEKQRFNQFISNKKKIQYTADDPRLYISELYNRRVKVKRFDKREQLSRNLSTLINGIRKGIVGLSLKEVIGHGDPELMDEIQSFDDLYSLDITISSNYWNSLRGNKEAWMRIIPSPPPSTAKMMVYYKTFREYCEKLLESLENNKASLELTSPLHVYLDKKITSLQDFITQNNRGVSAEQYIGNKTSFTSIPRKLCLLFDFKLNIKEQKVFEDLEQKLIIQNEKMNTVLKNNEDYRNAIKEHLKNRKARYRELKESTSTLLNQCFKNNGTVISYIRPLSNLMYTVYKHPSTRLYVPIDYLPEYPHLPVYYTAVSGTDTVAHELDGMEFQHFITTTNTTMMPMINSKYYIEVLYYNNETKTARLIREGVDITKCFYRSLVSINDDYFEFSKDSRVQLHDNFYDLVTSFQTVRPLSILQQSEKYISHLISTHSERCLPKITTYVRNQLKRLYYKHVIQDTRKSKTYTHRPFLSSTPVKYMINNMPFVEKQQERLVDSTRLKRPGETTVVSDKQVPIYKRFTVLVSEEVLTMLQNFHITHEDYKRLDQRYTGEIVNYLDLDNIMPRDKDKATGYDIIDRMDFLNAVDRTWYFENESDKLNYEATKHKEELDLEMRRKRRNKPMPQPLDAPQIVSINADYVVKISRLRFETYEDLPIIYFD
uniref:Uncharacterized protein n=1 Tax=viral metagenome TaxID=1070528 RepID=A0A6C0CPQ5_9ZZZZ